MKMRYLVPAIMCCIFLCVSINCILSIKKLVQSDSIHEGILCTTAKRIKIFNDKKLEGVVKLSKPVMIAQAEKDEEWGYFQFPSIGKADDRTIVVKWQMQDDSYKSYGKKAERECVPMMSKDGGNTWKPQDKKYKLSGHGYLVKLKDGSAIQVYTPSAKDIRQYNSFPEAVGKIKDKNFYYLDSLPEDLQGIYFTYREKDTQSKIIHAKLYDPGAMRYAIDNLMPIVWKGNIKELANGDLITGVYPTYYMNNDGDIETGGISFYKSVDQGKNWTIISKIPFHQKLIDYITRSNGFEEPAFEVLADSSLICVMRTGSQSPMYRAFSYDKGNTWTTPEPITPNGVRPRLLLLKNGVLVLVSGRPGVQLRFSFDGTGRTWSKPIDMIPFNDYSGDVSCGYASIVENDDNSFYLVYSNFITRDKAGNERKSIWFRKVYVNNTL